MTKFSTRIGIIEDNLVGFQAFLGEGSEHYARCCLISYEIALTKGLRGRKGRRQKGVWGSDLYHHSDNSPEKKQAHQSKPKKKERVKPIREDIWTILSVL